MMILPDMFVSLRVFSHDMSKRLDNKTSSFYLYSALIKSYIIDVNIVLQSKWTHSFI